MTNSGLNTAADRHVPQVTVVVPTFRRKDLLKQTVDSILSQTYRDFELIIVDNMSEDGTADYVAGINDPRVRYYRNPNGGVIAVNRNFGIQHARGEYVALCDDDDLWLREKLAKQVAILDGNSSAALCYTNASTFRGSEEVDAFMMKKRVFRDHYRHLLIGNMIPNSTVLVRRRVFEIHGYFDTRPNYIAVEDYEMWLKLARCHSFHYIDEALIRYRLHATATSANVGMMATKSFRVCVEQSRYNLFFPFYMYAFSRALMRMITHRWIRLGR